MRRGERSKSKPKRQIFTVSESFHTSGATLIKTRSAPAKPGGATDSFNDLVHEPLTRPASHYSQMQWNAAGPAHAGEHFQIVLNDALNGPVWFVYNYIHTHSYISSTLFLCVIL
jgi:hypothetical protein